MLLLALVFTLTPTRADYSCRYSLLPHVEKEFNQIRSTDDHELLTSHLSLCAVFLGSLQRSDPFNGCSVDEQRKACAHCQNVLERIRTLEFTLDEYQQKNQVRARANLDEICTPIVSGVPPRTRYVESQQTGASS